MEQNKKQLAVLEAAYQQGYVTKPSDIRNLAQVYYLNELPYEAVKLMEKSFAEGVLDRNLSNQKFYAQSLMQAKEYDAAITAYQTAAEFGDAGDMLAQAAQLAINKDANQKALQLAEQALAAGDVKNPGNLHLVIGMAYVNTRDYQQALAAFKRAADYQGSKTAAQQWAKYATAQQRYAQQMSNIDL